MPINQKLLPLATELQLPAYAGLDDQQATDLLNAEVATGEYHSHQITDLTLDDLFGVIRRAEIMAAFDTIAALRTAEDKGTAAAGEIAARTVELLRDRSGGGFDLGKATAISELPAMVTAKILTQAEADQLLDLVIIKQAPGKRLVSRTIPVAWVTNIRAAIAAGEV